jgi:hypothetical protein
MDTNDKKLLAAFTAAVLLCVAGLWWLCDFVAAKGQELQSEMKAEAATLPQRFTMAKDSGGMAFDIYTITDSQTGKTYLVARTSGGVAITPLLP